MPLRELRQPEGVVSRPLFTVTIPTLGRPSLPKTLAAIPADVEVIVVADTYEMPPAVYEQVVRWCHVAGKHVRLTALDAGHHDFGSPQLALGYAEAQGAWVMNEGDDDIYEPFAFETMQRVIDQLAEPVPLMFRTVLHPSPVRGNTVPVVLWYEPVLEPCLITGQSFVIPNDPARLGSWERDRDLGFIRSTVALWGGQTSWQTSVISQCY